MATHSLAARQRTANAAASRRPRGLARKIGRIGFLIVAAAVVLYPLAWMIGTSFKSPSEIVSNVGLLPEQFTPGNYSDGWVGLPSGLTFGRFFANSFFIAACVVVANSVSCLVAAFAFGRLKFPLRGVWFAIMIGTLLLPHHVLVVPQYILFRELGWIGTTLPMIVPKLLATEAFFVFLMVQFIRGIPRDLDEAAKIDGCSVYRLFLHIILPLSRPALVTTAIFSFIWTWNDYFTQLVYLTDIESYTVPIGLRFFLDSTGQSSIGPMFAMSALSLIPVFGFFVAFQKLIVEGINTSGLKG